MTPERLHQLRSILEQVDSHPAEERTALLDRLCVGDSELRHEVEELLAIDLEEDSPIANLIGAVSSNLAPPTGVQERFGRYQIVRRIGQGGMGAVFEAVRVDDFRKKVALKIIRQEFDSDFARTRFQQERQMLAVLEHPYIARLIDGGESESGSPYLVLEYVEGVPISQYCETLDRKARLNLFLKVCDAVDYAHRNLIIHRDLKPGNILVTENGDPKLLDFGIAKLLDPSATLTQTGLMALTPEYASPEQVRGEPISTASDVYTLGVILYQILTGRKPYTLDSVTPLEMDRVICRQSPVAPGLGDELDHILLMALRKEPARRYRGAREFAQDIENYLSLRPVLARPDTTWYRARKYVRRQWVVLAWASFAILALVLGTILAIRASWRADAEAAVAKEVTAFLQKDLLSQASSSQQPDPEITVRKALDRAADRLGQRFAAQPPVEASLRETIGVTYHELGLFPQARVQLEKSASIWERVAGKDSRQLLAVQSQLANVDWNQGRPQDAETRITEVLNRQRRLFGPDDPDTLSSMQTKSMALTLTAKYGEAEKLVKEVTERNTRLLGPQNPKTLAARSQLVVNLYVQGRYAEAADVARLLLPDAERVYGADNPETMAVVSNLAGSYLQLGEFQRAAAMLERGIAMRSKIMGPEHPNTLMDMNNLGFTYMQDGQFEQSEAVYRKLLEIRLRVLGPDHQDTLVAFHNLGACLQNQGKTQAAMEATSTALERRNRVLGPAHPMTISSLAWLGLENGYLGNYQQGEKLLREALAALDKSLGPAHPDRLLTLNRLATVYRMAGRLTDAESAWNEAYRGLNTKLGVNHLNTLLVAGNLAFVELALGKPAQAEARLRPVAEIYKREKPDHWGGFRAQALLGESLAAQGRNDEAEPFLLGGYQGLLDRRTAIPADSRYIVDSVSEWIAKFYRSTGRANKAAQFRAHAVN